MRRFWVLLAFLELSVWLHLPLCWHPRQYGTELSVELEVTFAEGFVLVGLWWRSALGHSFADQGANGQNWKQNLCLCSRLCLG